MERIDTERQAVLLEGGQVSPVRHPPGPDTRLGIYSVFSAAGDPVHPPHPVYWDRWDVSREVRQSGVSPERRAVV